LFDNGQSICLHLHREVLLEVSQLQLATVLLLLLLLQASTQGSSKAHSLPPPQVGAWTLGLCQALTLLPDLRHLICQEALTPAPALVSAHHQQ
jgi:hypothetical protein